MPQTIDVLLAVDVEGALSSGNLNGNLYMMDTTGYLGSSGEGTNELVTKVPAGAVVTWSVAPIDPGTNVAIVAFGGAAVQAGNIKPEPEAVTDAWSSEFIPTVGQPPSTTYQYNATLAFGRGQQLSFDPFIVLAS